METILVGIVMGAGVAIGYLAFAAVIALVCRVPFKIVAQFWKDYDS